MIICAANKINKSFGGNQILTDISFEISEKDRLGIVGANGGGKTTLFKIISGIEKQDNGTLALKKGTVIGYLQQIPEFRKNTDVYKLLRSAFIYLDDLAAKMTKIESKMSQSRLIDNSLLEQYGKLQEEFERLGGYEIESKINKVVEGLNLQTLVKLFKNIYWLDGGSLTRYQGNYEEAKLKKEMLKNEILDKEYVKKTKKNISKNNSYQLDKNLTISELELKINKCEKSIEELNAKMLRENDLNKLQQLQKNLEEYETKRDTLYTKLENIMEMANED